jgi:hypothetical protein
MVSILAIEGRSVKICPGKKHQQGVSILSYHSGREGERGFSPDRQNEVDMRKDRG